MIHRVISACLLGQACRYDGKSKRSEGVTQLVQSWEQAGDTWVAVCPEELGGLGTPRPGADLRGGDGAAVLAGRAQVRVVADNTDVTSAFVEGAHKAAALAGAATHAILKARSPSCGCGITEIDGARCAGDGVFAALLRQRGLVIQTDEAATQALLDIAKGP